MFQRVSFARITPPRFILTSYDFSFPEFIVKPFTTVRLTRPVDTACSAGLILGDGHLYHVLFRREEAPGFAGTGERAPDRLYTSVSSGIRGAMRVRRCQWAIFSDHYGVWFSEEGNGTATTWVIRIA